MIFLDYEYCLNHNDIYIKDFDETTEENKLLFKTNSKKFSISSQKIIKALKQNGYEIEDLSDGKVDFLIGCDGDIPIEGEPIKTEVSDNPVDKLSAKIQKVFNSVNPNIEIKSILITPTRTLPKDFNTYKFLDINIHKSKLKRKKGIFLAHYLTKKKLKKTLYFKFSLDAFIPLYVATSKIRKGTVLSQLHYQLKPIDLDKMPSKPLNFIKENSLIARFDIKKDTILVQNQFKQKLLLNRGALVTAYLRDGGLILQTEAKTLDSGNKGDIVRIRTSEGKNFNAIIEDERTVQIK